MAQLEYDCSGIVSTADQTNAIYLPPESLDAQVSIADMSPRVVLKQLYSHNESNLLPEAYYVFPVPACAAVCGFELKTKDGVELKGVVKELSQAKEDYEEARSKGWFSGFLEQFRQDVFVVSIGAMPPNTDVTVLTTYVVNLFEDNQNDCVRFQLSSFVRARYGAPSTSALYHDKIQSTLLSITVDIEMPGAILGVISLNHNPFLDVPVPPSNPSAPGPLHHVRKRFNSPNLIDLQKDFSLIVYALGLGKPRCLAGHLSHEENSLRGVTGPTTALACIIFPKFDNPRPPIHEYLFLIDRSESMTGTRFTMAKEALKLLLKQLPSTNAMFNIYSFAYTCNAHWYISRPTTEANIREATNHVESLQANGGTEMLGALLNIFWTRRSMNPTSILVITDGTIYNVDQTVEVVRNVVSKTPITAPLRVFTIGIGSGASTELCESLAVAGNGLHWMMVDGEPLATGGFVDAMQAQLVEEMSLDWGGPSPGKVLRRFPAASPGMCLLVVTIVPGVLTSTEVEITLRLSDGTVLVHRVPVRRISHIPDVPPLVHTFTAHILIQSLEWGEIHHHDSHSWDRSGPEARRDAGNRYIVQLGTQYQIATSRTAFVAVAAGEPEASRQANNDAPKHLPKTAHAESSSPLLDSPAGRDMSEGSKGSPPDAPSPGSKDSVSGTSQTAGGSGSQDPTSQMPGSYRHSPDAGTIARKSMFDVFAHDPLPASTPMQDVLCIPNPQGGGQMIVTGPLQPLQTTAITVAKSWLKSLRSFVVSKGAVGKSRRNAMRSELAFPISHNAPIPKEVIEMTQLQSSSDGSFARISPELSSMVDIPETELRGSMAYGENNESVWATAIAVAFCRKKLVTHAASWEDMAERACQFGSRVCGGEDQFEAIVQEASKLF